MDNRLEVASYFTRNRSKVRPLLKKRKVPTTADGQPIGLIQLFFLWAGYWFPKAALTGQLIG
jgi:hypothetical protein